jgi:type II secretory pathway pseudopilin PulG
VRKQQSHSYSLIEIILACVLIAIASGGLLTGWVRYQQTARFNRAKHQIEHLLEQAHFLAVTSDQFVEVGFTMNDDGLQISFSPWTVIPKDKKLAKIHFDQKIKKVLQSLKRDDFLEIGAFSLNDDASQQSLIFLGKLGLIENRQKKTDCKIVLQSRSRPSLQETISLEKFYLAPDFFEPFPEECSHET